MESLKLKAELKDGSIIDVAVYDIQNGQVSSKQEPNVFRNYINIKAYEVKEDEVFLLNRVYHQDYMYKNKG